MKCVNIWKSCIIQWIITFQMRNKGHNKTSKYPFKLQHDTRFWLNKALKFTDMISDSALPHLSKILLGVLMWLGSLLGHGFSNWPGNFHILKTWPKKKLQVSVMRLGHRDVNSLLRGHPTQVGDHLHRRVSPSRPLPAPLTCCVGGRQAQPPPAFQPPPEGHSQALVSRTDLKIE